MFDCQLLLVADHLDEMGCQMPGHSRTRLASDVFEVEGRRRDMVAEYSVDSLAKKISTCSAAVSEIAPQDASTLTICVASLRNVSRV